MQLRIQHLFVALTWLVLSNLNAQLSTAHAQGTAFTYQGQLQNNGSPASGTFNLTFSLFPVASGGLLPQAGPVTNNAVSVTNGLFTVAIDFGSSVWNGQTNWLQIGVATNGVNTFTALTPRQQLTPTPYAIYASNAGAAASAATAATANGVTANSVTGGGIAGGSVVKSLNSLQDAVTLSAGANVTITPSGNTLTIASSGGGGSGNSWSLTGNSGTTPGVNFLGTLDDQPLELWVNGALAWSLVPGPNDPSVVGGAGGSVASGMDGATIAGGVNNTVASSYGTVGGGFRNTATNGFATVSGGEDNTAGHEAVVGGGYANTASGQVSVVGGGAQNVASGIGAFIGGGGYDATTLAGNTALGAASTVSGGMGNSAFYYAFVGGGQYDSAGGYNSAIVGGYSNNATTTGAFVGGGYDNTASGFASIVPGGLGNTASGNYSLAAGQQAQATNQGAFVWADSQNATFTSTSNNQFSVRASGGVRFVTGGAGMTIDGPVAASASSLSTPPANGAPILNMVWIVPGTFILGSPDSEQDRYSIEGPQTVVTLTNGYWMGQHPVTQGEYQTVVGSNPSAFTGDLTHPVDSVTWLNATNYCYLLTQQEQSAGRLPAGWVYRLPTEAEWEYCCRALTTSRFYYGNDPNYTNLTNYAWYDNNSGNSTQPVGQKLPNAWGLVDMAGNVSEWCQDWYGAYPGGSEINPQGPNSGLGRVQRGGGWDNAAFICRSAQRFGYEPAYTYKDIGFRVVLAPSQP